MQCNKMLIKVLKLFLIFQFSTKDYIAKTQVYTSVFETFTQYCNNHSVQLVTSMHSDHLPLVMTAIVPDSAGCRSMLVHGWCSRRRRLTAEQILHTAIQYIDALRLTWGVDCRYLASKKNNTSSFLHSGWASGSACSLLANPVKTWSGYQPIFSNNSSLCSMHSAAHGETQPCTRLTVSLLYHYVWPSNDRLIFTLLQVYSKTVRHPKFN